MNLISNLYFTYLSIRSYINPDLCKIARSDSFWQVDWDSNIIGVDSQHINAINSNTNYNNYSCDYGTILNSICAHSVIDMNNSTIRYINDNWNNDYRGPITFSKFNGYSNYCPNHFYTPHNYIQYQKYYNNNNTIDVHGFFNPFTLSTINNLESPIEKTDEQMMKITYELTITE